MSRPGSRLYRGSNLCGGDKTKEHPEVLFQSQLVRRIGFRACLRQSHRLRSLAAPRPLATDSPGAVRFTLAPLSRFESMRGRQSKRAPGGALSNSTGAAYRIRTYDVLIRSQTLYPAEVTPQRKRYILMSPQMRQELFSKLEKILPPPSAAAISNHKHDKCYSRSVILLTIGVGTAHASVLQKSLFMNGNILILNARLRFMGCKASS